MTFRTADDFARLALAAVAPPARADWWDWIGEHLVMPARSRYNQRRGRIWRRWVRLVESRLTLTPTLADPWAHRCEQLWIVGAAQISKTAFLHAIMLASTALAPRKLSLYMSRIQDLKAARKAKLQRQVLAMPVIERLLPSTEQAREQALAADIWTLGASQWFWLSGGVADDWRAQDFPLIFADEFDRYPQDVEGYGDPIDHGLVRQRTHPRSKLMIGTTSPGLIHGHGWRRLCGGSHERLMIACPACGGLLDLVARNVQLTDGLKLHQVAPARITAERLARYRCRWCDVLHPDADIRAALNAAIDADRWVPGTWTLDEAHPTGHWQPLAPLNDRGQPLEPLAPAATAIRSAWASALYSDDVTLDSFAASKSAALRGTERNLLANTTNDDAEPYLRATPDQLDPDQLAQVAAGPPEHRRGSCPVDAWKIVLFEDQQGNTTESAWYPWIIGALTLTGDLYLIDAGSAKPDDTHRTGDAAIAAVESRIITIAGKERPIDYAVRDSANGNLKFHHYLWAAATRPTGPQRLLTYGDGKLQDGIPWQEVVDHPNSQRKTSKPKGVREYRVHPHHWRTIAWDRLRRTQPDQPKTYIPSGFPAYALRSFTSEEPIIERRRVAGGWHDVLVWRPRVTNSTADTSSERKDTHWWDGLVNLWVTDDLIRQRLAPIPAAHIPAHDREQTARDDAGWADLDPL